MAFPPSRLDADQIIQLVFDEPNQRLRVDTQVTATFAGPQEVVISHVDDSIKVGDGVDLLAVNADGSINANTTIVEASTDQELLNYSEISSVGSGSEVLILAYTVPAAKVFRLHRIEVSGNNLAEFRVRINTAPKAKKLTWWGDFNETFDFIASPGRGLKLVAGDIITTTVLHNSTSLGDFNASIQGQLADS